MLEPAAEPALPKEVEIDITPKKKEPAKASIVGPYVSVAVRYGAYISLIIALVIGLASEGKDYEAWFRNKFKDQKLTKVNDNPVVFQLGAKGDGPGNYVLIQEGQGYGGPFVLGIRIMEDGKIHEIIPLDHKETPAFVKKIEDAKYRDQFIGKSVSNDFIVGVDINAVSGATVTTMAAAEAIRNGAHLAAVEKFKLDPKWKKVPWKFGLDEILILVIFVLAFVPQDLQRKAMEIHLPGRNHCDCRFLSECGHIGGQYCRFGPGLYPRYQRSPHLVDSGGGNGAGRYHFRQKCLLLPSLPILRN